MSNKTALIAGATGLVGKELVKLLINDPAFREVKIISRRSLDINHEKIKEILIEDFEKLDEYKDEFNVNQVFCCLGTTMKKAGSKEMFRKIDVDYPIKMAELAKGQDQFETYHIVTSIGSSAESALFYNKVKGEVEDALKKLDLKSLKIYQPSLLLGKRSDFRLMEEIGKGISAFLSFFVIGGRETRLWSIKGEDVARSMQFIAIQGKEGLQVLRPKDMIKIAHAQPL